MHVRAGLDTPAHQVAQRPTDRSQQTEQRQDQRQGRGIRCRHDAGLIEQGVATAEAGTAGRSPRPPPLRRTPCPGGHRGSWCGRARARRRSPPRQTRRGRGACRIRRCDGSRRAPRRTRCVVVRRDASATRTSLTCTESRVARSSSAVLSTPGGSDANLLKTGSITSGYANDTSTTKAAAPAPAQIHHDAGTPGPARRTSSGTSVSTRETAKPFARSAAQLPTSVSRAPTDAARSRSRPTVAA